MLILSQGFGINGGGEIEVSNFDPAPGTPIAPTDTISFDVSGAEAYLVHVKHGGNADEEIVFDNTLFVPPVGSKNRQIEGTLGKYKLDTGNGILLHGTPHKNSIGRAATHGCLRLRDEDIEWLYDYIPIGTKVYIY